jgi:hypothetical protein
MRDFWEDQPSDRSSSALILWRLSKMDFRIAPGVRPEKVRSFVTSVKHHEDLLGKAFQIGTPSNRLAQSLHPFGRNCVNRLKFHGHELEIPCHSRIHALQIPLAR